MAAIVAAFGIVMSLSQPAGASPRATQHHPVKASHRLARGRGARHRLPRHSSTHQLVVVHPDLALSANVAADPDFIDDCPVPNATGSCLDEALSAISRARAVEGVVPVDLDTSTFLALPANEQLFVITNLERTARGLAPFTALSQQLDAAAASGAQANADPVLRGWTLTGGDPVLQWSSNWAGGLSGIGADYMWMYADGPGVNADCPAAGAVGCWGHRANILMAAPSEAACSGLGKPAVLMGAAFLADGSAVGPSVAELYVGACGRQPGDVLFTWASARRLLGL